MIFKNYKCPYGTDPEYCCHVPQLINNLANYFANKSAARKEAMREKNSNVNNQRTQNSQANKSRYRG